MIASFMAQEETQENVQSSTGTIILLISCVYILGGGLPPLFKTLGSESRLEETEKITYLQSLETK